MKTKKINNRLGEFLKEKRIEAGLSQSDISKLLGYTSGQFVSNWERGVSSPPMDALATIVNALKIDQREITEIILEQTKIYLEASLAKKQKKSRKVVGL